MNIKDLRKALDDTDRELIRQYEKRLEITGNIAATKIESGKPVLDQERELQVLSQAASLVHSPEDKNRVRALYRHIMNVSRSSQYKRIAANKGITFGFENVRLQTAGARVVYQGVEGAYSWQAAASYFGTTDHAYYVPSFEDVMKEVQSGNADFGVLPAENSSTGIITQVYDLLNKYDVYIVAKYVVRVKHALLGIPGAELSDIHRVYSHPQGLLQCGGFLSEHPGWEQISMKNTAVSARKVLNDNDIAQAAVCSPKAAEIYSLKILKDNISDNDNNSTIFLILGNKKVYEKDANEISITFTLSHETGSLYQILGFINNNNLNMTKIESRPIPGEKWRYRFFINFNGSLGDSDVLGALTGIREETENFRILGNYIRVN